MTSLHPVSTCAVYTPQKLALISSVFVLTTGPQYKKYLAGVNPFRTAVPFGDKQLEI